MGNGKNETSGAIILAMRPHSFLIRRPITTGVLWLRESIDWRDSPSWMSGSVGEGDF
jgi:hypothetical protein